MFNATLGTIFDPIDMLSVLGVIVFAATGALAASRKQLDLVGFLFFASITAIGGGTLRDLILDRPVFWVTSSTDLAISCVVALIVYLTAHWIEYRYRLLLWLDAIGVSAYCVLGAELGINSGAAPLVAILCGMLTATFGGILRDVIIGEPSVLLRREIYITAALCGSALYVVATILSLPNSIAIVISFCTAFAIRGGALYFGWVLPGHNHKPGRPVS